MSNLYTRFGGEVEKVSRVADGLLRLCEHKVVRDMQHAYRENIRSTAAQISLAYDAHMGVNGSGQIYLTDEHGVLGPARGVHDFGDIARRLLDAQSDESRLLRDLEHALIRNGRRVVTLAAIDGGDFATNYMSHRDQQEVFAVRPLEKPRFTDF